MNNILIIIGGILSKHFLERLCLERDLEYFFTIVYQDDEDIKLHIKNEYLEFHKFDSTSVARLELLMQKAYKQVFIYLQDKFQTQKTYEALRSLDTKLEINIMDFWGLSINDELCNLIDARATLSHRFLSFLPNIALTAQYIGLGVGEVMEVKIPIGSIFAYRHISSIHQKRWRIVLIYRNSKINFAKPSFILQPNDSILIVGDPVVLRSVFHNIKASVGQFPVPFGSNIFTLIDMKNMSEKVQNNLIETSLTLVQRTNAKKFFIRIINPQLNQIYTKLKNLSYENENIFFDFFNTNFKNFQSFLENNDIGLFITDTKHFEREKKNFFELKIPILKIGEIDFKDLKESVILSDDESELENQANVIVDLSKQLQFNVTLYHYNPHSKNTADMQEYFESLSKLYDKNIQIIDKNDHNPILNLQYREDLLQFISFNQELLNGILSRSLSVNLNRHYHKMKKNYQLFIPMS
ncbi:COG3400 family protein [Campylobacter cuniculorum]|nr:TrkA C-terminal domain-containing protein [Campylobacter cuniculorum]QOR04026.1 potassium transporter TrkA [Campylobacter cuniculorum]